LLYNVRDTVMLKISYVKTENLKENCITDKSQPQFSFRLESDLEDVCLEKARVGVNGWMSETTSQIGIMYGGNKLKPFTTYTVNVVAEDNHAQKAEAETTFETGRMGLPWQGDWITDGSYQFTQKKVSPEPMVFQKDLIFEKPVKNAHVVCTALGIYEIKINGKKIGKDYFTPGFTSYHHQMQYQIYDITDHLSGNDTLTATVCGGWAVGKFTHSLRNRIFAKRQAFLCEIRVGFKDGSTVVIGTDNTWKVTRQGVVTKADFYDGEVVDSRVDINHSAWTNASIEKVRFKPEFSVTYGEPVRAHEELQPREITTLEDGTCIVDFGQNIAGVIKATFSNCTKGQTIIIKHAEILMDGKLFTKPLRTAKQEITYICSDRKKQEYTPSFAYMGFRYVSVEGIKKEDLQISALALYSDIKETGTFHCSNDLINQLQSNIVWSTKSNFVDIPTDCPQRDERMGWTGDIALFSPTASFNFDTSRFYDKWLKDLRSDQKRTGGIPVTIPHVVFPTNYESVFVMAIDHWGDSCILVPWAEYMARGNIDVLKSNYETMKLYLKACKFWAQLFSCGKQRRIWSLGHHYGDWCAPNIGLWAWMGRGKWTATACFANSCRIMVKIANELGYGEDALYFHNLYKEISSAYIDVFTDGNGKLKNEFQTAYVLPLVYEVFNGKTKTKAANNLAKLVRENNYNIATGFPGTPSILFALCDNNLVEDAYKMLLTESCPSWLFQVKAGATTLWERWDALRPDGGSNTGADDGTKGMVSFNHYANGSVGNFFYKRIAGIEPIKGGYKEFGIKPILGGDIKFASATYECPYGMIKSSWKIEDGHFNLDVEIPVGTECHLAMPSGEEMRLHSGKFSFQQIIK
jgi:alpha-L-rhamnosidase